MRQSLCQVSDIPEGSSLAIQPAGMPELVICHVEGHFYALDGLCSHGNALLAEGELLGCEIECPLHSGRFDIRTGRATRRPAKRPVTAYDLVVEDGVVYYEIEQGIEAAHEVRAG